MKEGLPGRVRVLQGAKQVLLDTHEATVIEFRDQFGDLNAVISRHFNDDMWIFTTKADDDWHAHLVRLGYSLADMSVNQLVHNLRG
jgi:hypothetical protein